MSTESKLFRTGVERPVNVRKITGLAAFVLYFSMVPKTAPKNTTGSHEREKQPEEAES